MRYTVYIPLNAKDLAIVLTKLAYENWQNAIRFARANKPDLLWALKYLIKTRLFKDIHKDQLSGLKDVFLLRFAVEEKGLTKPLIYFNRNTSYTVHTD